MISQDSGWYHVTDPTGRPYNGYTYIYTDFLPRLEQARAEVNQLEAEILSETETHRSDLRALRHEQEILELAKAEGSRAERLQKKNLGSDSALDGARQSAARQALTVVSRRSRIDDHPARLQQLQARLAQAQARLDEARLDRERSRVVAPFDGVIAGVSVAPGNRVKKADVMLEMYARNGLEVRARIPSPFRDEIQKALRQGLPVSGKSGSDASRILLRLERLSGASGPRGIDALFRIERGQEWLRLGDMLQFQLQRPPKNDVLALPYQALYGGTRVYLLEEGRLRGVGVDPLGSLRDDSGNEHLLLSAAEIREGDQIVVTHLPNAVTGLRAERQEE